MDTKRGFQAVKAINGPATRRPKTRPRTSALVAAGLSLVWPWCVGTSAGVAQTAAPPAGAAEVVGPAGLLADNWDVITIQGTRVGFGHTRTISIRENGRQLYQTDMLLSMKMKRLGQTVVMKMNMQSVDTPEGELVRTRSSVALGPTPVVAVGQVQGDKLKMRFSSLGKTTTTALPWSQEYRGFFALEQSLKEKPLQPGQRRQFKALVPVFNQIADVEVIAEDYEDTEMLDGPPQRLLKINTVTSLGIVDIKSTIWSDSQGEILKMVEPSMKQETFRATRQVALQDTDAIEPDLIVDTLVPVEGLGDADQATSARYRVSVTEGQPEKIFPNSAAQTSKVLQDGQALITVQRLRVQKANDIDPPAGDKPTAKDREPNNWIQSDNPLIVRLASEVMPDEKNHGLLAAALERRVHELITEKDFTTALATAAEVAKSRQGDCTEHAVLLAALARARGIPARIVVGLLYVEPLGAFGYHMWNEAWIDGAWLPLDATRGQAGTGVGHIKLTHSHLNNGVAAAAFLPVVQVMGRLEIEVDQVER
jgi:transglutaminase-like putative cysteine protease